jgi:hypothetical protein
MVLVGASVYDVITPSSASCSLYVGLTVTLPPSVSAAASAALRHELSGRGRALQQFVRLAHFGERKTLRDDRVDLAAAKHWFLQGIDYNTS